MQGTNEPTTKAETGMSKVTNINATKLTTESITEFIRYVALTIRATYPETAYALRVRLRTFCEDERELSQSDHAALLSLVDGVDFVLDSHP